MGSIEASLNREAASQRGSVSWIVRSASSIWRWLQQKWWIVALASMGAIALFTTVHSRTYCRYMYQVQLDQYLANPAAWGRAPEMIWAPLDTVLLRVGGRLLSTVLAWVAWSVGLWLATLLLGQGEFRYFDSLQVIAWSWLPLILRSLAGCVYMELAGDPMFNSGLSGLVFDNTPPPPGGGYHYVMPTQTQQIMAAVLAQVDLYLFVRLALMVRGLRQRTELRLRGAAAVVLVLGMLMLVPTLLPVLLPSVGRFRLF